jgi:NCAIR mutase (PurE)-related protein
MDANQVLELLKGVQGGTMSPEQALQQLAHLPYADIGVARVDHHRALRQSMPEVVFGESKTQEQIVAIARELLKSDARLLVTRVHPSKAEFVMREMPQLEYHPVARVLVHTDEERRGWTGAPVAVVTAGTGDLPVAEEACQTLRVAGVPVYRAYDAGVAGLHRLTAEIEQLADAPVVIVVAGMEGALPSVVGGLVRAPIIAVPTSIGYGTALSGFTALFSMLSSCAPGLTVVNIDNGFGAAMAVMRMVKSRGQSMGSH